MHTCSEQKKKDTSLSTKVELPVEQPQSLPMTEEPQDLAMTEQQQDLGKDSPNELQKKKKARVSKPRPPLSAETSTEPTAAAVAAAPEVTVSPTSETKPKKRKKKVTDSTYSFHELCDRLCIYHRERMLVPQKRAGHSSRTLYSTQNQQPRRKREQRNPAPTQDFHQKLSHQPQ